MNAAIFSRTNFRRAALASVVALGAFGASSSFAVGDSATASATVIAPIAIAKSVDLAFGSFTKGATGGSVTVSTSGDRTASGSVILSGTGSTAAQFDVTGDNDAGYSITWSGDADLTTAAEGTGLKTMELSKISNLTGGNTTTGTVDSGTLSGTGAQSIYLGGTLAVDATQEIGAYTGSVTATVEYN